MARVSKLNIWFKHYINDACSTTFLNQTESARKAGYNAKSYDSFRAIGYQNFTKLSDKIENWLNNNGLSDNSLKIKLLSLLECEETKFITIKGKVEKKDLPKNTTLITYAETEKFTKDGSIYTEYNTLVAINMEAKEIQRKTLDMAIKVKSLYGPVRREFTGKDGGPIEIKKTYSLEEREAEMKKRGIPIPLIANEDINE